MTPRDKILIILGMHRNGTSFLAHCTEVLGFSLPLDRGGPAEDNRQGHFEPQAIVDLNNLAMARAGAWWARIGPLAEGPTRPEIEDALDESFGDARKIVLKDPRLSLLMDQWRPALEEAGPTSALIAIRHPGETATSLARRDAIGTDLSFLSWMAHTFASLDASIDMPRSLVLFPDWIGDVKTTLTRIASVAGVDLPNGAVGKVEARFDADAVHGGQQLSADTPEIDLLARDLFELLARHARSGTMPDTEELAPFQKRFRELAMTAIQVEAANQPVQAQLHETIDVYTNRVAQLEGDVDGLVAGSVSLQQQVEEVRAEREAVVAELQKHIAATEAQRDNALEQLNDFLATAEAQLAEQNLQENSNQELITLLCTQNEVVADLTSKLEAERMSVIKPIYRRIHRSAGRILRPLLPGWAFDRLKRSVPFPDGIPTHLAYAPPQPRSGELRGFDGIAPASPDKSDIFVMSIINWDFRTQRPQHLATEMARAGHRVFFVEMETEAGGGSAREVAPNVYVLRLPASGMRTVNPYDGKIPLTAQQAWIGHFYRIVDQLRTTPRTHIVVEHPYWWNFVRHLPPQFQITFDCMDEIAGFANTEQAILDAEENMIAKADRMIVSSQYLYDKYARQRPVALVRNGTDVSHFVNDDADARIPDFLAGKLGNGAIKVGYVGAIAEWFDTDLLEQVARENPDFELHLCGSVTAAEPARLDRLSNVTLHGEIPYADVPAFLRAMDVLIIPFRLLPIIKACDPVKFYEYSAVRRPTVATALPELARAGDLVTTASDAAGFAAGIRQAATAPDATSRGDALRSYALDNAWSYRAADILAEMDRAPSVSVVVLAYGKADLTLACLESLVGQGDIYPDFEVLVVDNGSDETELARLRDAARPYDNVRLIENGENLGFAKGNNVGIEAARGDYVLLLNNDTYVPPGALQAMVGHLEHNPELGIVGPLTNNIGNEAKLDLSYADMTEMQRIARDLTTGYRGRWTAIPVAAYFCAMFRKADLDRVGHLPTVYGRGMFEDDDHCASFRAAGFEIALAEDAFVHHHLSATFDQIPSAEKTALFETNKKIFEARWGEWVPHRYRASRPPASLTERS
ncbi:glycosyltransferase [Paracoccus sp. SCSIO 75233]|uniref:glycosyltransferase n=1 Tax=Paracoccus sp. SCSIO 75233 TaxID=3017782 RepID=UPI0022F04DE4|nr:glycosyltransferase [Paracoccus sp. SCSIO 75233]WBU53489.1 glycosyltransferase [Paracoccus sp. SCSIO 75233]